MSTGSVIPGISYVEVLKILNADIRFDIEQTEEDEADNQYSINYFPNRRAAIPDNTRPADIDDIFNVDRHGDIGGEYLNILMFGHKGGDMKNTWFFGYGSDLPIVWNAILDVLGDDYFGLTEYDELYADYIPDEPPEYSEHNP
jgi:hypothetical protein